MEKIIKNNNRKIEFIKNTLILLLGKFTTQFMSLLLLPLYTRYLIAEDFGVIDLLQTYISLFVPILTLRVDSAVFRFLIDKRNNEKEKSNIISNISFIMILAVIITTCCCIIFLKIINIKYGKYVIFNLVILMISNVLLQLLRGLGRNILYSVASIVTGISTLCTNILLIIFLKMGAESILISSTISNILCIILVIVTTGYFKYVNVKKINKITLKEILVYSLPMIPNSLSWWIVNVSDRTIISYFLGTAFNGIYSVSCKFSNILNSIFSIFSMSWQETATLHINDKDKDEFFSKMINEILMFFSTIALMILVSLPIIYNVVIGENYVTSYNYIPILLYANSWNVLIGLIGGIYVAKKKTKEIANTTLASAIINIIINILLIKWLDLYAACISTLLSYLIMGMYRYIDCRKYVKLKLNIKSIVIFSIIFCISSIIYIKNVFMLNILNIVFSLIYCCLVNKNLFKTFAEVLKKKNI